MFSQSENKIVSRIVKSFVGLIPKSEETPQEIYERIGEIFAKQSNLYMDFLTPEIFLRVVLNVYTSKVFGDAKGGDKIIQEGYFATLLGTDNLPSSVECESCGGDGEDKCWECDGDGQIVCDECHGNGLATCPECDGFEYVTCPECDGNGYNEDDEGDREDCSECKGTGDVECKNCKNGKTDCDECSGDGYNRCYDCHGTGNQLCGGCDGDGQVKSETKIDFTEYSIFSWDKNFKNLCEIRDSTPNPVIEKSDFFSKMNVIVLSTNDEQHVPGIEFDEDMLYCMYLKKSDTNIKEKIFYTHGRAKIVFFVGNSFYYKDFIES